MSSPWAPASAVPSGRRALGVLVGVAAAKALGLVLIAEAAARGVTGVMVGEDVSLAVFLGVLGAFVRGAAAWAQRAAGARAAVGVKTALRRKLIGRSVGSGGRDLDIDDGALVLTATRSLDDLDDYFTGVLPALTASAVIPLAVIVRIVFADWVSAALLVITLPLVPVFMILIGRYTEERVGQALKSLDRLSDNLVELARGLPVLVGLGRVRAQTEALVRISDSYRRTTMQTLKVAFLSALALELISTLSVALVAVFIGVRLVNGTLDLSAGLLALVLAPEVFLPLRQLGAAFHSTENGLAVFDRIRGLIASPRSAVFGSRGAESAGSEVTVQFAEVSVSYGDSVALPPVSGQIGPGLTVLTGASGAGKSTFLGVLAGLVRPGETASVTGSLTGVPDSLAFADQSPRFFTSTVGEELRLFGGSEIDTAALKQRAALDLDDAAAVDALSPGEARRLSLARAFARVDSGAQLLIVDEPTAHLDDASAARIRRELQTISETCPVIAASHDPVLTEAGTRLHIGAPARDLDAVEPAADPVESNTRPNLDEGAEDVRPASTWQLLRRAADAVGFTTGRFWLGVLSAVGAVAAGTALTAVSAWLIVYASFQPPIMYLLVAIVGVRFFGLSRSVLTYTHQLNLHHAILGKLASLRRQLWQTFAREGTANRAVARSDVALRRLVSDVDDIRDAAPRVLVPPLVAVIIGAAAVVVFWIFLPQAALALAAVLALALTVGPAAALLAERRAGVQRLEYRARVLGQLTRLLAAKSDLIANGKADAAAAALIEEDERVGAFEKRILQSSGLGEGIVTFLLSALSALMLVIAGPAVISGSISAESLAILVLVPLALIDAYLDSLRAVQQWPALASVLQRVPELGAEEEHDAKQPHPVESIRSAQLRGIRASWPTGPEILTGVNADIARGRWTTVTGPSGSGKTTLVSVILRFLDPSAGTYTADDANLLKVGPEDLAGTVAWCPQEAHVFNSSLRANLLIARDRDDRPGDDELLEVLRRVGLDELARERGLDAVIGAGGEFLSGGQRGRLAIARTLLTGADVIVIDEPTAHLDVETAQALMADLRETLDDRAVVMVTHDQRWVSADDLRVKL